MFVKSRTQCDLSHRMTLGNNRFRTDAYIEFRPQLRMAETDELNKRRRL